MQFLSFHDLVSNIFSIANTCFKPFFVLFYIVVRFAIVKYDYDFKFISVVVNQKFELQIILKLIICTWRLQVILRFTSHKLCILREENLENGNSISKMKWKMDTN